jgi:hypothetical protein
MDTSETYLVQLFVAKTRHGVYLGPVRFEALFPEADTWQEVPQCALLAPSQYRLRALVQVDVGAGDLVDCVAPEGGVMHIEVDLDLPRRAH